VVASIGAAPEIDTALDYLGCAGALSARFFTPRHLGISRRTIASVILATRTMLSTS
jgi:hypothetical protein